jgi:hypothetical protein
MFRPSGPSSGEFTNLKWIYNYICVYTQQDATYGNKSAMYITILDTIHHPVFCTKYNVSESGLRLRFQVELTQLHPLNKASLSQKAKTSFIYWVQPSRFHLKTETEWSLRNVYFKQKIGRWIMSRIVIVILVCYRYEPTGLKYSVVWNTFSNQLAISKSVEVFHSTWFLN